MVTLKVQGHCAFCGGLTYENHRFCTHCGALVMGESTRIHDDIVTPAPLRSLPRSISSTGVFQWDVPLSILDEHGSHWCTVNITPGKNTQSVQVDFIQSPSSNGKALVWRMHSHGVEPDSSLFQIYGSNDEIIGSCSYHRINALKRELRGGDGNNWGISLGLSTELLPFLFHVIPSVLFHRSHGSVSIRRCYTRSQLRFQTPDHQTTIIPVERKGFWGQPWFGVRDVQVMAEYIDLRVILSLFVLAATGLWAVAGEIVPK